MREIKKDKARFPTAFFRAAALTAAFGFSLSYRRLLRMRLLLPVLGLCADRLSRYGFN